MNQKQHTVILILVPSIIFVIGLGIASQTGWNWSGKHFTLEPEPFNWGRTWVIWTITLGAIATSLFFLLREKK